MMKTFVLTVALCPLLSLAQDCSFQHDTLLASIESAASSSSASSSAKADLSSTFRDSDSCPCFHDRATPDQGSCPQFTQAYDPTSPLLPCSYLPDDFVECDSPVDHRGNRTARDTLGEH